MAPASASAPASLHLAPAVLAVQGDFAAHARALGEIGARPALARTAKEVLAASHLVLPGGESTTMLKFLARDGLEEAIREFHASGRPIFATCAGVILLAREVRAPAQHSLGLLDVAVERNAYGRQLASFTAAIDCPAIGAAPLAAVFIRAPVIRATGPRVKVLATHETPVLVREGNVLAATFHPEMAADRRVQQLFLAM
jgi:5'-phosphate synthase pdxT subunit